MSKGFFITLEGGEGCGKTTAAKELVKRLTQQGYQVIYTREPGGVKISEKIRKLILDKKNSEMDPVTEAILYAAARRQHLVEKIIPGLEEGKIVICDRFIDSSLAYQGYARGLGIEKIYDLNLLAIGDYLPDSTYLFDLDPEVGLSRIAGRESLDRLETEQLEFHEKVRKGYSVLSTSLPYSKRIYTIDASKPKEEVSDTLYMAVLTDLVLNNVSPSK